MKLSAETKRLIITYYEINKNATHVANALNITMHQVRKVLSDAGKIEVAVNTAPLPRGKINMPDRHCRDKKDPLSLAIQVLGDRFNRQNMTLDNRVTKIDDVIREANKENARIGAEQIKGKDCWIV